MSISAVDIDGDKDFDLIVGSKLLSVPRGSSAFAGTYRFFENVGGTKSAKFVEMTGTSADAFDGITWPSCCHRKSAKQVFIDFDHDGDIDLFNTAGYGRFSYFENNGNITNAKFEKITPHPLSKFDFGSNLAFAVVDIDNDEDWDFVVANQYGGLFSLEPNGCYPLSTCNGRGSCKNNKDLGGSACECFANSTSGFQCQHCPAGKIEVPFLGGTGLTNQQALECGSCDAGLWSNVSANLGGKCTLCKGGRFSSTFGANSVNHCLLCPQGYASKMKINGSTPLTSCTSCISGRYQNEEGKLECQLCQSGSYRGNVDIDKTQCLLCPAGYATNSTGQPFCLACDAGRYSSVDGATTCIGCQSGSYRGNVDIDNTQCLLCPAGYATNGTGQSFCLACDAGRYSSIDGATTCIGCPEFTFQDSKHQTSCISKTKCPSEKPEPNDQRTGCTKPAWVIASDCSNDQYLNNTSLDKNVWICQSCPSGGACDGLVTLPTLSPLFGWWPIPPFNHTFAECYFHPACPGARNPKLIGKYLSTESEGKDPADQINTVSTKKESVCAFHLGFRNHSRLCHTCANGYRRGSADTCIPCPKDEAANWGLIVLGFFVILSGCLLLVYSAIRSKGKQQVSEMILKIMLNYFQVANMARVFPLHWPPELEALFDFQGAFSTVGGNLLNPDCLSTTTSAAELFYSKQALFACFPFIIIFASFCTWFIYATCIEGVNFFAKRVTPSSSTAKDSFIITVGTVLYLIFPTLINGSFQLFDCRTIDNPDVKWLYVDLEEQCYVGRHFEMMLLLGVSQLMLYVVGLPLLMLFFLVRNSKQLDKHATKNRYGMFFASYKKKRYYWEMLLSLRKISIVALGVFGPVVGPVRQSQLAQFILLICIVLEIVGKPYSEETKRHEILDKLETAVLMVLWGNFGGGTMIYESIEMGDGVSASIVTILTVLLNSLMIVVLIIFYLRAVCYENRNTKLIEKIASFHFIKMSIGMDEVEEEEEEDNDVGSAGVKSDTPDADDDLFGIELGVLSLNNDTVAAMSSPFNPMFGQPAVAATTAPAAPGNGKSTARQNWNKIKRASKGVNAFKANENIGSTKRMKRLSRVMKAKDMTRMKPASAEPITSTDYAQSEFYMLVGDDITGPLTGEEMSLLFVSGDMSPDALCSCDGGEWKTAKDFFSGKLEDSDSKPEEPEEVRDKEEDVKVEFSAL